MIYKKIVKKQFRFKPIIEENRTIYLIAQEKRTLLWFTYWKKVKFNGEVFKVASGLYDEKDLNEMVNEMEKTLEEMNTYYYFNL